MIRFLEDLSLNAWPAHRQMHFDGWVIRFGGGYTRRANSVSVVGPSVLPIDDKIQFCRDCYALAGLPSTFKVPQSPEFLELDEKLDRNGFQIEGTADVMVSAVQEVECPDLDFRFESQVSEPWLTTAIELNRVSSANKENLRLILDRIQPDHGCASIWVDGRIVCLALAVFEREHMGLYDVVTAPDQRRRGYARALLGFLNREASQRACHTAYIQVMRNNPQAAQMYGNLGFQRRYTYWYRTND